MNQNNNSSQTIPISCTDTACSEKASDQNISNPVPELPVLTPIVFPTALDYWLGNINPEARDKIGIYDIEKFKRVSIPSEYSLCISSSVATRLNRSYGFLYPITVAAPNAKKRADGKLFKSFTLSKHIPADSFIQLNSFENVFVACPELCFIQAANYLSMHELVEVACNLCAIYVMDKSNEFNHGRRGPITTVKKIKAYIDKSGKIPGKCKACMAIQYATNRSNSPMESKLATIFKLPFSHGGYGLPAFEMNYKISLSKDDFERFNIREISSDFVWKEERLAVEYDSNMTHLNINQHVVDKRRTNMISNAGYSLITLTSDNIIRLDTLDYAVEQIRTRLRLRKSTAKYSKYATLRLTVMNDIFKKHWSSYTERFCK